ncbi:hypothetical protein JHK85_031740 [Glycine max]|nr:hypothetical protein JHK85_031740 [Glycine max]
MEEMSKFQNEVAGKKHFKREGNTKTDSHRSDNRHKPGKRQPLPKGPRYECYTTLTTNHTTILEEAFNLEVPIKLPPLLSPRLGLDKTKYCRYHCNIGYNTEDCWALKEKIKELIQAGAVQPILQASPPCHSGHRHQLCRYSITRSHPLITFIDRNFKGINPINQNDPVVVSIAIANFMVSKVLISQGNSTDILYWKTFQRLEVSLDTIQPYAGPLLGFAGESVETRGYVNLMSTFG